VIDTTFLILYKPTPPPSMVSMLFALLLLLSRRILCELSKLLKLFYLSTKLPENEALLDPIPKGKGNSISLIRFSFTLFGLSSSGGDIMIGTSIFNEGARVWL
jgi:hypothetical protein